MELTKAIEIAKKYYLDKEVPNTTREWAKNCPPELTPGKINSLPFTVGDVLTAINPKARKRGSKVEYDLSKLGFETLNFIGTKGTYKCKKCGNTHTSERSTILRWLKEGIKYCSICRNTSGQQKSPEYYNNFLPNDFTSRKVISAGGNTKIEVEHTPCGNTRIYSSRHILNPNREYLVCSICEGLGRYDSKQEKLITEHIISEYPSLEISTQVKYSSLVKSCTRRWVSDIYIPDINLVLEITTYSNGFDNYYSNLEEKLTYLNKHGYIAKVVYSTTEVDDIVRSLLKDKES